MDVDVVNTSSTESFHVTAVASGNGNTANSAISESNVSNTLPSEPAWTNAVPPVRIL